MYHTGTARFFFFQAEDGIRDTSVTGVQTCALPIAPPKRAASRSAARPGRRPRCARSRSSSDRAPDDVVDTADRTRARFRWRRAWQAARRSRVLLGPQARVGFGLEAQDRA